MRLAVQCASDETIVNNLMKIMCTDLNVSFSLLFILINFGYQAVQIKPCDTRRHTSYRTQQLALNACTDTSIAMLHELLHAHVTSWPWPFRHITVDCRRFGHDQLHCKYYFHTRFIECAWLFMSE